MRKTFFICDMKKERERYSSKRDRKLGNGRKKSTQNILPHFFWKKSERFCAKREVGERVLLEE